MMEETPLDILMKATHYVENQGKNGSSLRRPTHPIAPNDDRLIKENGHSDHIASSHRKTGTPAEEAVSQHLNKQQIPRHNSTQDESGIDRKRESMRFTEVGSTDETAAMSQHNRKLTNGILPSQLYGVDEKLVYRSTASPLKSPRKRSSSPSRAETDQPAKIHMPQQLHPFVASANQPGAQLPTANPVMPFVHPLYSSLDPTLYAEAMARQTLAANDANRPGASPASSSNTPSISDSLPTAGLPRLMYPLSNSALLMAPRAPTASGYDIPMVIPPQFATAYGQTAGLLPQQLAAWSASVPDAEKRILESMTAAGVSAQQWLTNPYLKNFFAAPNNDLTSNKDASRSAPKPAAPAAIGLPAFPSNYTAEFALKYPEALNSELLKQQEKVLASQSMSPRISPENSKKSVVSPHLSSAAPFPPQILNPASLTKSPILDWKVPSSTGTPRCLKTEAGPASFESRPNNATSRRDAAYTDNRENQMKADEARLKLAGLSQRPGSSNDLYAPRYNSHERQSPSPYAADRWGLRRRSRDFSPHLSPNASEKMTKKRSLEGFGITRDPFPSELKNHSPSAQASIPGLRQANSPPRGSCRSPMEHPAAQSSVASGLFASLAGKPNPSVASDKDNPAYFAPHPYIMHPAFSGYPYPFALPATAASYLCQPEISGPGANKAVADAFTAAAAAQAQAAGTQLFRSALSQEHSAITAELAARLTMSQYVPILQQQQLQQALKAMTPSSSSPQDYATVLKHAAMQQSLFLDGREKERVASPSHSSLAAGRRFMLNSNLSPAPKMTRASPSVAQNKTSVKNSTTGLNHLYNTRPVSPIRAPDSRPVKREPSPGIKRPPAAAVSPHVFPRFPASSLHPADEARSNRLKRKAVEDRIERDFAKDSSSLKRKRELTTANTGDVEEHFRRSLGNDYKESDGQNKVRITGNVEDHFVKALGNDVWSKVKSTKSSGSPGAQDAMPNGREQRPLPAAIPSALPPYSLYHFSSIQGAPGTHPAHPMLSAAGSRTVKSGGTIYPDVATDSPTSNASSSSAPNASDLRSESTKRASAFPESRSQPPSYDSVTRRAADVMETNQRTSTSPVDKTKKYNYSQNGSPRSNSSQNSGDRLPASVASNSHQNVVLPPQAHHNIPNGFSKSPNKPPPPAYSPQNSTSASSNSAATSPPRPAPLDRQPSEDSNKSAPPMPVQT